MTNHDIREHNMQHVIEVAMELFYLNGIDGTKISDIAEKAGLTPTSVYRYFNDKDTIILKVAELNQNTYSEALKAHLKEISYESMSGFEQEKSIVDYFLDQIKNNQRFLLLNKELNAYFQQVSIRQNHPFHEKRQDAKSNESISLGLAALEKGLQDGSIRNDIPLPQLFELIYVVLLGSVQMAMSEFGKWEKTSVTLSAPFLEHCREMVLGYLRPQSEK
jgi:AcrR family transcriptional regulator